MAANSFGDFLKIHSFGESHGRALGVVIDGLPAGLEFREDLLLSALDRRRPGQNALVSGRQEGDRPEILSGLYQNKSLGTPLTVVVWNQDARSQDYAAIAESPRAGHADDVWKTKFGHSDPRGGGRSSGRETLSRVIAGAFARMLVERLQPSTQILSFAEQIGPHSLTAEEFQKAAEMPPEKIDAFPARFPSSTHSAAVEQLLLKAKVDGKSYGGKASLLVKSAPSGLGRPVFHKLKSDFAQAFMSIGATISFELGDGLEALDQEGSQFHRQGEKPYGGIRGGISTGEDILLRVGFKPTSSVMDVAKKGRHDPCIVPRALPVMEAMAWLVLANQILARRLDRI
jgi:chorismate synthase